MDAVARGNARHLIAAFKHKRPIADVFFCIGNDNRRTGSTGRRMDPNHLFIRYGLQPQWIGIPQIPFPGKRKFFKILLALYRIRVDSRKFFTVKSALTHQPFDLCLDQTKLFFFHFHVATLHFIKIANIRRLWRR